MSHMLSFSRNRCTSVEQISPDTFRSTCQLGDNLMDARVRIHVRLPELEVVEVSCRVEFSDPPAPPDVEQRMQKVLGARVGPGLLKIIKGLVGEGPGYKDLGFMLEECCHGIILSITKNELSKAPLEPADSQEFFANLVRNNIRLYNRCAAFAAGSSLVEGLEPPG